MNIIDKHLVNFFKFHSREWVNSLRKRVEAKLSQNPTDDEVEQAIIRTLWTIDENNPYLQ